MSTLRRPILSNSCAQASTATEVRHRIDRPIIETGSIRVIALDHRAAQAVGTSAPHCSSRTSFFALTPATTPGTSAANTGAFSSNGNDASPVLLSDFNGRDSTLEAALHDADLVVMVAAFSKAVSAVAAIGARCGQLGITMAGIVLGQPEENQLAISALRPHATMLLVSHQTEDLTDILTTLRA